MRLGIKPAVFLVRLLVIFFLTYLLWTPFAPAYTQILATLTKWFLHLTEISRDPNWHQVTEMWVEGTNIFYKHRLAGMGSGIPAEWVQANLVLLIPLMLATPAQTYKQRFGRLGLALGVALILQVLDIAVTVKSFYASQIGGYGELARRLYQFGDAFAESMDTQLFPFAIWAGIHLKQLLGRGEPVVTPAAAAGTAPRPRTSRKRKDRRAKAG
ncbi:MAG: hypothetical protein ACHQ9S_10580 [Candidatus Binatia bacterium]